MCAGMLFFWRYAAVKKLFRITLSPFERGLYVMSLLVTAGTYLLFQAGAPGSVLPLAASLTGVTALILVAKGHALGQVLTIVFAVLYGVISFKTRYYGEMITYLGMTAPMALMALVTWLRNPYRGTQEVAVRQLSVRDAAVMLVLSALVTAAFWFILRAMGNAALPVSTLSVTTSFLASYLTALRSPYYALAYAANDLVLIVLWVIASSADPSGVPMVACFAMFLVNDLYGFVNWRRMARRQRG